MFFKYIKLCLLLPVFLLCSCGFKLRGYSTLPGWFNPVIVVEKTPNPFLRRQLNNQFFIQGIEVVRDIHKARFLLVLENEAFQQLLTAVAASTTPRQYQINYHLNYSILSASGKMLRPTQSILVIRQLTVNNDRILGSNDEEKRIKQEMLKEAAIQVFNQIATIHDH